MTEALCKDKIRAIDAELAELKPERDRLARRRKAAAGLKEIGHSDAAFFESAGSDLAKVVDAIARLRERRENLATTAGYLALVEPPVNTVVLVDAHANHVARVEKEYGDLSDLVAEHHRQEAATRPSA